MPIVFLAHGVGMGGTETEDAPPGGAAVGTLLLIKVGRCIAPVMLAWRWLWSWMS